MHETIRNGRWRVTLAASLLALTALSCGSNTGTIVGRMFVPQGVRGENVRWGEVWLLNDNGQVENELRSHERILVLALLGKDTEFLRQAQEQIEQLGVAQARLNALSENRIPRRDIIPPRPAVNPISTLDSLIAGIRVESAAATPSQLSSGQIDRLKEQEKQRAREIRRTLNDAVRNLRNQRNQQKQYFLSDADAIAAQYRVKSTPVAMDGRYTLEDIRPGTYSLYGRYSLTSWFEIIPVTVGTTTTTKDIPRLPGIVQQSRASAGLEALCSMIERR